VKDLKTSTQIRPPLCTLCGRPITNPDDLFYFGHLTEDRTDHLYKYNYVSMHHACMARWEQLPIVYQLLEDLDNSGDWWGPFIKMLLKEMQEIRDAKY
jgi:hypothetical protein